MHANMLKKKISKYVLVLDLENNKLKGEEEV